MFVIASGIYRTCGLPRAISRMRSTRAAFIFKQTFLQVSQFHTTRRLEIKHEPSFYEKSASLINQALGRELKEKNILEEPAAAIIRTGNLEKLTAFIHEAREKNLGLSSFKDKNGKNLLHYAAIHGQGDLVETLVENGIMLSTPDSKGMTPLHWAIHQGHAKTVRALIARGAQVQEPLTTDKGEIYPFAMAVAAGNPDVLKIFLEKDYFQQIDLTENIPIIEGTVLHLAIRTNQTPMLEYLLQELHGITRAILQRRDKERRTPLQLAAFLGDLHAIRLLDAQGVDLNEGANEENGTAFYYAARGEQPEAIQLLDSLGARITPTDSKLINIITKQQNSFNADRCRSLLHTFALTNVRERTELPNFKKRPPFNLIFEGGGPKGIAEVGAYMELEAEQLDSQLKRVAGTSAGSIIAAAISVGYRADELKKNLFDLDFGLLLDPQSHLKITSKDIVNLAENPTKMQGLKTFLKEYWDGFRTLLHPIQTAEELIERLSSLNGVCDGEKLRETVEELIEKKTGIKHCTFKELEGLIKLDPKKYKELHVFAIRLNRLRQSELIRFSHKDERWHDLIISDAIRASVSIPGVFVPHTLHFKDADGNRYPKQHLGQFVDGGLVKNYPLEAFDSQEYQEDRYFHGDKTNRRSLGVSLQETKPPKKEEIEEINSPLSLAKAVALTYIHAQQILREEKGVSGRTITVPIPEGIHMMSFELTDPQKNSMIASGRQAVTSFFDPVFDPVKKEAN